MSCGDDRDAPFGATTVSKTLLGGFQLGSCTARSISETLIPYDINHEYGLYMTQNIICHVPNNNIPSVRQHGQATLRRHDTPVLLPHNPLRQLPARDVPQANHFVRVPGPLEVSLGLRRNQQVAQALQLVEPCVFEQVAVQNRGVHVARGACACAARGRTGYPEW